MSPLSALHDPVFRAYLLIVPVSLGIGGAILGFLRWGLKKELGSIWKTYRSWLVMASIALLVVFAGRVPVIIGVTLLSIFGFKEFARSSIGEPNRPRYQAKTRHSRSCRKGPAYQWMSPVQSPDSRRGE